MSNRQQIRDAVKAKIEALSGNAGKVYGFKRETISTASHAIIITLEEAEVASLIGDDETTAVLSVLVLSPAVTDIDDALDTIATPIETAMESDRTLTGNVISCQLVRWEYEREADDAMTGLRLGYRITY